MRQITHLIYDFDGLLLNTEPIYCQVNQTLAQRYGKNFTDRLHAQTMGRQALVCAEVIITQLELPLTPEEYIAARDLLIYDLFPTAQPMPGAIALTQHFHRQGIPQAIATSSARRSFSCKSARYQDWLALFNCIVVGDDPAVKRSKPEPDSFLAAASRLGAEPENCLVFEDAPAGIEAAKRAGMAVIAVPDKDMDWQTYQQADLILPMLSKFDPLPWGLPAFDGSTLSPEDLNAGL